MHGVLTVLTDVSALKAAENKVREVEAMLRDMTDSMPGVVYQYQWHRSEQGRFLYVSQGSGETLGVLLSGADVGQIRAKRVWCQ